jgi:hypothetical protein
VRGNGNEDKREIGEIFRGYRNSQKIKQKERLMVYPYKFKDFI